MGRLAQRAFLLWEDVSCAGQSFTASTSVPGFCSSAPFPPARTNGRPCRSMNSRQAWKCAVAPGRLHTVVHDDAPAGNNQGPDGVQRRRRGQVEVDVEEDRADGADFLPVYRRAVALDDAVVRVSETSKAVFEDSGATVGVVGDLGGALLSIRHLVVDALPG